jgi:predicted DNA-binding transcriptional regulator YafY
MEKITEREVSPQRIVHYRDNWYLDAWCHHRNDLRSFSIDAISQANILELEAKELAPELIENSLSSGYGIFAGITKGWAKLKFTPARARWVAGESWHPLQRGATEPDGSYLLEFPYSDERELIGDILHCGPDVEVIEPKELRLNIKNALVNASKKYE